MLNIKNIKYIKITIYLLSIFIGFIGSTYATTMKFKEESSNLVIGSKVLKDAKYLFVLHSEKGYITNSELTLKDFYQHLVYFSDMPNRVAGNYDSKTFLEDWKSIFSSENPNVVLSFYDKKAKSYKDITVEISNPVIDGDDVVFKIERFLDAKDISTADKGNIAVKFKHSSLFIDSIGCWIPACWL